MKLITIILFLFGVLCQAQCDIKTTLRPDGHTIKYFNPKPIIRAENYEVGISLYKNMNTKQYFLNVSVLFKNMQPVKLHEGLTIQMNGKNGIILKLITSNLIQMNGRELAIGLYEIDKQNLKLFETQNLKSLFFYLNNKMYGTTLTENNTLLIDEINCFNKNKI